MKKIKTTFLLIFIINICLCQSAQEFTDYFKNLAMEAGGVINSILLPDGSTLWLSALSHIDQGVNSNNELPCLPNVGNCLIVQDTNNDFTTLYDTLGTNVFSKQFVKMTGETGIYYWPAGGFVHNDTIYIFYERYENNPCLLYTSPSPRDATLSRMPSSA